MSCPAFPPADGGCACGDVRYRVEREPMFVHCCHCTRCQRETGGAFAHHAMVEFTAMSLLQGEPEAARVPSDSGAAHWVFRCPACRTALWNEWGSRSAATRYLRVGTLDEPARCPPRAHIFVRSKQPWLALPADGAPVFEGWYDAAALWPVHSRERCAQAKALKALKTQRPKPARAGPSKRTR
jgi:hypothetical protein